MKVLATYARLERAVCVIVGALMLASVVGFVIFRTFNHADVTLQASVLLAATAGIVIAAYAVFCAAFSLLLAIGWGALAIKDRLARRQPAHRVDAPRLLPRG